MPRTLPPSPSPPLPSDRPSLLQPGSLRFDTDRLPWQRSLRWTEPARDRRLLFIGGAFALLVTLLELGGFALGMRSYSVHAPVSPPIQVSVIEMTFEPPPPEPEPPPFVARPSRVAVAPPEVKTKPPPPRAAEESHEMRARLGEAGAAAPQLFNPDGSIRLGGGAPTLPKAPTNPHEAGKARWAQIETRGNPIDCHKTRFAQAFAPDESVGSGVARKYLKWVGLADMEAIARDNRQRAESGGCEPAPK